MITKVLLLVFLVLVILHFSARYSRHGRIVDRLPGLKPYPIIGNLWRFTENNSTKFWDIIRDVTKTFYPITRIWYIRKAIISIRHPDDAEILLASQKVIEKGYVYDHLHPWLKTGLLTSTGDKWRNRRKILTPAFHFNILKKYLEIMNEQEKRCVSDLEKEGTEIVKSAVPFSSKLTLNIICESAMGVALDKVEHETADKYKKAIHDFGYIILFRIPRPYVFDWMMKLPWKLGNMQRNVLKVLDEFTDKVVKDRKTYHSNTQNQYLKDLGSNKEDVTLGGRKRLAMLDLLLAAEKDGLINDEGIKEEVDTFTFEGHDTTGMAMTFTLLLLAENKEAQDRAREEVTTVMDKSGDKLDITDLQEMPYLERCIKESLRLYPPVSTILRYVEEDLQLKHGLVPGGTHIVLHIFDTHRDPNFWPDPEKFDPDRFLPEFAKTRHPYAYVPFSAGPRNCIGQKFAMMELKSTFAHILYNFYLEPVSRISDLKLIADIVIRPNDPVTIKFVKINKK